MCSRENKKKIMDPNDLICIRNILNKIFEIEKSNHLETSNHLDRKGM